MKKNRILGFCLSQLLLLGTVASASGATAPAAPVSLDGEWELLLAPTRKSRDRSGGALRDRSENHSCEGAR